MAASPDSPRLFLVYAACAFASGFALRIIDPLIVPIAAEFSIVPDAAALLSSAYALPYALAQPFLGPLGDRFGKLRCIRLCVAGVALALLSSPAAGSFDVLVLTRIVAGVFAGGLIPLVLAGLGDAYALHERQAMIGRMLFAIIGGQMLGSVAGGYANDAFGWRGALLVAALPALAAAALAWRTTAVPPRAAAGGAHPSFVALYRRVFDNAKAKWLYAAIVLEGALVFGLFPHVGSWLIAHAGSSAGAAPAQAGLVLAGFAIGGIAYAMAVRAVIAHLGVRRMCLGGAALVAATYAALAAVGVWWLAALTMAIAGFGYYMLHNSLQTEATEIAPSARASAVSLFACGFFAGQALGPPLFGALVRSAGFAIALIGTAVGLMLLGMLVGRKVIA
jgi:predicted MFS family arabinose efflux permease